LPQPRTQGTIRQLKSSTMNNLSHLLDRALNAPVAVADAG
jgi:hypothetical protein